jgi:hypothetical protein
MHTLLSPKDKRATPGKLPKSNVLSESGSTGQKRTYRYETQKHASSSEDKVLLKLAY